MKLLVLGRQPLVAWSVSEQFGPFPYSVEILNSLETHSNSRTFWYNSPHMHLSPRRFRTFSRFLAKLESLGAFFEVQVGAGPKSLNCLGG